MKDVLAAKDAQLEALTENYVRNNKLKFVLY